MYVMTFGWFSKVRPEFADGGCRIHGNKLFFVRCPPYDVSCPRITGGKLKHLENRVLNLSFR